MDLFMQYCSGLRVWTSVFTCLASVILLVASPSGLGFPQDAPKTKSGVGGLIGEQTPPVPPSASQSTTNMSNLPESDFKLNLPDRVGGWNRDREPLVVTSKSIFDYMDGAGELYLGYRFCRLDVYTYKSKDQDEIVAELYWMKSSDDAFGLLSQDWGGEPQDLASHNLEKRPLMVNEFPQALYGAGLLRIWSNNLYVRVMATQENAPSRDAVMAIGKAIVADRASSSPPKLLDVLPSGVKRLWTLRSDRLCFLRSHLVMNSVYFLSTENLLNFTPPVEAVSTVFDLVSEKSPKPPVRLLLVRYAGSEEAQKALEHFMNIYLPEKAKAPPPSVAKKSDYFRIEDGWMGYQKSGRHLILVFECPDPETATSIIGSCMKNLRTMEASNE